METSSRHDITSLHGDPIARQAIERDSQGDTDLDRFFRTLLRSTMEHSRKPEDQNRQEGAK